MFQRSHLLIVGVAVLGALLGLAASGGFGDLLAPTPAGVEMLKIGDARADLDLVDLAGKPRRLGEFDGKLVLVNFWASWCGPCREEMPLLDATRTRLAARGIEVVGIAIDDGDAVNDFLREHPVSYPILLADDAGEDPSLRYGDARGVLPYSVLIGRDGRLLDRRAGNFTAGSLERWLAPHLN